MDLKTNEIEILVLIKVKNKTHQIILSQEENRIVVSTIDRPHDGCIKVLAEPIEGIKLINNEKKKKRKTK